MSQRPVVHRPESKPRRSLQRFPIAASRSRRQTTKRVRVVTALMTVALSGLVVLATIPGVASADRIGSYDVVGSILNEYNRLKAAGKSPGNPQANEKPDRQNGKFQDFVNNNHIYWNARVDPGRGRQIGGAIFTKWGTLDYENGVLGYPTTPEGDGARGGKFNRFEGGMIYYSGSYGAHPIFGQILETWAGSGADNGPYGYPKGDEENYGDGKRQLFENGKYIEWHPEGFDSDWAGDTYQDDLASNNSDAYVPDCDANCGLDASTRLNGGPYRTQPNSASRSSAPSQARGDTVTRNNTPFCEDLKPDSSAAANSKVFCLRRNNLTEEPVRPSLPSTSTTAPSSTRAPASESSAPSTTQPPSASAPSTTTDPSVTPSTTPPSTGITSPAPRSSVPTSSGEDPSTPSCAAPSSTPAPGTDLCATTGGALASKKPNFRTVSDGYAPSGLPDDKDYCNSYASDFPDKVWQGDRMFQCRTKTLQFELRDANSGAVIGVLYIRESRNQVMSWDNTAWLEHAYVYVQRVAPLVPEADEILRASTVAWRLRCTAYCYPPADGPGESSITSTVGLLDAKEASITFRRGLVSAPPNGSVEAQDSFDFAITNPLITPVEGNTGNSRYIRCDAKGGLRSKQGCAFRDVTPIMDYTQYGSLDEFRAHVRAAQDSGLPGRNKATSLTRLATLSEMRKNRRASCGGVTGPRETYDCDEYPFASTIEGPRVGGPNSGGPARTFPNCRITDLGVPPANGPASTGYSVCLIDSGQNRRAGAVLAWFYAKNRVAEGDSFYVNVG